ncbi:MAG: hypothetical protein ACK47B_08200 [Armatimonadota bacterium]
MLTRTHLSLVLVALLTFSGSLLIIGGVHGGGWLRLSTGVCNVIVAGVILRGLLRPAGPGPEPVWHGQSDPSVTPPDGAFGVSPPQERQRTLRWLRSLTDKGFAELFYEAVKDRKTDGGYGHFVLAEAARRDLIEGPWDVDFIGLHDREHYGGEWDDDAPICQSGTCRECGVDVRSWAKEAVCPVCGSKVYGT